MNLKKILLINRSFQQIYGKLLNHFNEHFFNQFLELLIFQFLIFKNKRLIQKQISIQKQKLKKKTKMIMNDFMGRVQKQMILLRKKNMNLINEFKIEMYQGRKRIEKDLIKMEYGIGESRLVNDKTAINYISVAQKQSTNKHSDNNLSTNHYSRSVESHVNEGCQVSRFSSNFNKENEDPNRRVSSEISVIEEFPVKNSNNHNSYDFENEFNLNALRNDESIVINTEQVRKKYQKFISPSAGWAASADSLRERPQSKGEDPFCNEFVHEGEYFDSIQDDYSRNDNDIFGFKQIDERHFSRANTIKECEECEQNNESPSCC